MTERKPHGNTKAREDRAESTVTMRVKRADKARWVKRAQAEGLKLTQWITDKLNDSGNK